MIPNGWARKHAATRNPTMADDPCGKRCRATAPALVVQRLGWAGHASVAVEPLWERLRSARRPWPSVEAAPHGVAVLVVSAVVAWDPRKGLVLYICDPEAVWREAAELGVVLPWRGDCMGLDTQAFQTEAVKHALLHGRSPRRRLACMGFRARLWMATCLLLDEQEAQEAMSPVRVVWMLAVWRAGGLRTKNRPAATPPPQSPRTPPFANGR